MTVEVAGYVIVEGKEENEAGDKSMLCIEENGKLDRVPEVAELAKPGSYRDGYSKAEGHVVSDSSVHEEALEEWPTHKQIHSFYFVKCRRYEDPSIKSKLDKLDKEINLKNQARIRLNDALRAKRSERAELISQLKFLRDENRQFQSIVDEKIKEIEPLQQALGKLRAADDAGRSGLCASEDELNDIIYCLQYRIQHESIPLNEEKQILREIKQLEGTREKVIANAAIRARVQDSIGQKESIQDQVKLIGGDLDGVEKERQAIRSKIKQLDDALKFIDKDIQFLQEELAAVTLKRERAVESIQQLRKERDEGNSYFFQSRSILNKAQELAAKKDINALEKLARTEIEKFMSLWSSDKAFRSDYEKRLLPSLDSRQLCRDGRMRNPDEMPLMEEPKPAETDTLTKSRIKQLREEPRASPHEPEASPQETLPAQKVQKETKNKGRDLKSNLEHKVLEDIDEYEFEKPEKEDPVKEPPINPEKLKEIKREEEIAKAKQALERKRRLAEKAAAKAAIRAQKEAEKKLKEREKKAKKAAGGSTTEGLGDEVVEATEQVSDNVEATMPLKEKVAKESSTSARFRSKTKVPDAIPKAILKKRRSNNDWVWISLTLLFVLVLMWLAYTANYPEDPRYRRSL